MERLKGYLEVKDGEIVGVGSTESVDRDGEVIRQAGWDLTNYLRNPVLMLMHNYQEFPIGKVTDIKVTDGKLTFRAVFSQATEKAREAYALMQEGILSAFSVGFIPRQYDPKDSNVITEAELLEISVVPVPANPDAIVLAKEYAEKHEKKESEIARYIVKNFLNEKKDSEEVVVTPEEVVVVEPPKEPTPLPTPETEDNSATSSEAGEPSEVGKEGEKASEIDRKLLRATVGHLQALCRELNKKGGVK